MADEVITTDQTVTYSLDGSVQSGLGKYVVQTLQIVYTKRRLPTMPIFSESTENLADYLKTTLKMLSAASGYTYSEKDIMTKIDFTLTDGAKHNLEVVSKVCEELEIKDQYHALLCHVQSTQC
jgi:hypothetical protein